MLAVFFLPFLNIPFSIVPILLPTLGISKLIRLGAFCLFQF